MTNVFIEQVKDLELLVPNFKIASAIIHYDETSPHMHIVGVPIKYKNKNGMSKQVGKSDVFTKSTLVNLQNKMRALCIDLFNKEYKTFSKLTEKKKGRNLDYNVSEMTNYQKVKDEIAKNQKNLDIINQKSLELDNETTDIKNIINNLKGNITTGKNNVILNQNDKEKIINYIDKVDNTNKEYKKINELSLTLKNVDIELKNNKILTEENNALKVKNNALATELENKNDKIVDDLFNEIETIILNGKSKIVYQINNVLVDTYFNIGKTIVENEQNGNIRAEYGKEVLLKLSKKLTNKYGSGFSRSNLQNMRLFYNKYENCQPLASNLSWSHYCYLIYINDDNERSFYEKECINSKWSKRELKRQIDSSLFQRLLLSEGNTNKRKVYELSKKGQTISTPNDILKEPYVFEFLGIKEPKPILESDLEKNLINHLSSFLMELGKGFMYVGNQVRITLDNNTHYYVDLVFYNKILHSYVLIDLKMDDMKPEYAGQMNMYVNYYNKEIKDEFDNETVGIILCKGKKEITMEYALGGLSNNIFASTYTYYIPNKEQLINELEKVLNKEKDD